MRSRHAVLCWVQRGWTLEAALGTLAGWKPVQARHRGPRFGVPYLADGIALLDRSLGIRVLSRGQGAQ